MSQAAEQLSTHTSDHLLITLYKNGSASALALLSERYAHLIRRAAWLYHRRHTAALHASGLATFYTPEDIRQEAFICFLDMLYTWDPARSPLPAYLYRYLHHRIARHFRTSSILASHTDAPEDHPPTPAVSAHGSTLSPELAITLRQAVNALPPLQRQLIIMRYWWDLTMPQVAHNLHIHIRKAHRLHHQALATLLLALDDTDPGDHDHAETAQNDPKIVPFPTKIAPDPTPQHPDHA